MIGLQGVSIANGAAVTVLNDTLHAGFGMVSSPFSGTGSVSGLAAGSTDTASLKVGLNTASAGVFTGTAAIDFASHDGDLADAALAPGSVSLSGTVNNFAEVALTKTGGAGTLTRTGDIYTLDFGSLALGDADLLGTLEILNSAFGPADLLGGSFDLGGVGPEFVLSGFTTFDGIVAGGALGGLSISLDSATSGRFEDTIVLHAFGSNASGFKEALADTTLVLRGDVFAAAVPEPGTYVLMVGGLTLLLVVRHRRLRERAAA